MENPAMEDPEIHAFSDDYAHRAEDLNAMGIAVMELVLQVNTLNRRLAELEEKAKPATTRKTA